MKWDDGGASRREGWGPGGEVGRALDEWFEGGAVRWRGAAAVEGKGGRWKEGRDEGAGGEVATGGGGVGVGKTEGAAVGDGVFQLERLGWTFAAAALQ